MRIFYANRRLYDDKDEIVGIDLQEAKIQPAKWLIPLRLVPKVLSKFQIQ